MLNSVNILNEFKHRFPDFEIYPEAEGLHTVVFSFFVDYLSSAFKKNDRLIISKASDFINEMCASKDHTVEACIDEIVLGFYTDPEMPYEILKKTLSSESQLRFEATTILWDRQKLIE
jgi:hypothetical protein